MSPDKASTLISSRYEVVGLLGEGGMGRVYKANDLVLNRVVAVKVLLGTYASQNIQRFQREAKTMSSLNHPNLIDVYDFGITDDGSAYLIMEYVVGAELSDILKKQKRLSLEQTISIAIAIADGMRHAHNRGVVHRDLKPSNILIRDETNFASLKIFDFGISKLLQDRADLTQDGAMLGTPLYMSPEQAQARTVDGRADQYSLGCIMYACITGSPPFRGDTAIDTIKMHINETPVPLSESTSAQEVPPALDALVTKLLRKDPSDRFASMEKLMEALAEASSTPADHTAVTKMRKQRKDRNLLNSGMAIGAVALAALGVCDQALRPPPPVKPAPKPNDTFWVKGDSPPTRRLDIPSGDGTKIENVNLSEEGNGSYSDGTLEKQDYDSFGVAQILPTEAFYKLPHEKVRKLSFHMRTRLEPGAMAQIARFPNLTELWFSGDQFVNGLSSLNGMKRLERLTLNCSTLKDEDLLLLTNLPALTYLSLENAGVTDSCLKSLVKHFPRIKHLDLGFTMLRGTQLGELKKLEQLERLELNNLVDDFDDKSLAHISGFPNLEVLDIAAGRSITEKGLRKVIAQNPKLNLIRITHARQINKKDVVSRVLATFKAQNRVIMLADEDTKYKAGLDRYRDRVKRVDFELVTDLINSGD